MYKPAIISDFVSATGQMLFFILQIYKLNIRTREGIDALPAKNNNFNS